MTMSASLIHLATSVVKKRFGWRATIVVLLLAPSHWLVHSDEEVEGVSDAMDAPDLLLGSFWKVNSREPSRATRKMSLRPGSYMGGCCEFHRRMRFGSLSTTVTRI